MLFSVSSVARNVVYRAGTRSFVTSSKPCGPRMIFLGAPGVGKGTFATRIAPALEIPTISTGDLVREQVKNGTAIGNKIKEINATGGLVPDEIISEMARERLALDDAKDGFILDGFPRTIAQAEALEGFADIDMVLNIVFPEDLLVLKTVSRRVCADCGNGYNLATIQNGGHTMPPLLPKREGICDKCDGKLVQRQDDTEEVVRNRLAIYHQETFPLIEHYSEKGLLSEFHVKLGLQDLPELKEFIQKSLQK